MNDQVVAEAARIEVFHVIIVRPVLLFAGNAKPGIRFSDHNGRIHVDIVSTLIPAQDGRALMVFDTRCAGRNLVTTLFVGDLRKDRITPVGQECLKRMTAHHQANYPDGKVHLVEIRIPDHVPARVGQVLNAAEDGDAVTFWCRTSRLYDMVFPLLGFTHSPAGFDLQ